MIAYLIYLTLVTIAALLIWKRDWATSLGRTELLVLALFYMAVLVWITDGTPLIDFLKAYYPGGRILWEQPQNLYECHRSNLCFVNLPILAALFSPFSFMPLLSAEVSFTLVGLALAAYAAWRLSDGVKGAEGRAVIALFMLCGPLAYSVRLGNTTHMLLPLMLLAFEAQSRGRQITSGLALALATLIKPFCALFLIYLLLRRQWAASAAMVLGGGAVALLSLMMFGFDLHFEFVKNYVFGFGSRPVIAYNVQNFAALIGHYAMPGNFKNWVPIDEPGWFKATRLLMSGVTMLSVATALWRAGPPRTAPAWLAELSAILCVALLVAPVTWTHYLCLLLIPMAFFVTNRFEVAPSRPMVAALAIAFLLLMLPAIMPHRRDIFVFFIHRIWVSHFVAGTVLLLIILVLNRLSICSKSTVSKRKQS